MILLHVPGEPSTVTAQQKGVNWNSRTIFTKAAVKAEKRRIKRSILVKHAATGAWERVKQKCPAPLTGPVQCSIKIRYPLTQAQAAKHAAQLSNPNFELRHAKRPDFDNTIKLFLDVLTELGFWTDDGQIADANIHKRCGPCPGIWVAIDAKPEDVRHPGHAPAD